MIVAQIWKHDKTLCKWVNCMVYEFLKKGFLHVLLFWVCGHQLSLFQGHDTADKEKYGSPFLLCTLHCAGPCSVSYFFRKSQVLETIVGILHSLLPSLWLLVLRELKTPVEVMSPKIRDTDGHVWRKSLQAWGTLVRTRNQIPITEEARMGSGIPPSLRSHFLG